jgi:hypothetical protein
LFLGGRVGFIGARSRLACFPVATAQVATDNENVVVALAVNVLAAEGAGLTTGPRDTLLAELHRPYLGYT